MQDRESKYYILPTSAPTDDRVAVLKHDDTFGVFDRFGDVHGEHGIYHEDTRHLSGWFLRLDHERPLLLSSRTADREATLAVHSTNPDMRLADGGFVPRGTLHLLRTKFLWQAVCYERVHLHHYGAEPLAIRLRLGFQADFADIFEVRGSRRTQRGQLLAPEREPGALLLRCEGLDKRMRSTRICFSQEPSAYTPHELEFVLTIEPAAECELLLAVHCETHAPQRPRIDLASHLEAARARDAHLERMRGERCRITTSSVRFNDWLVRSGEDLAMMTTHTALGPYPYAGVPWFSTPFGRDGIITALQTLWADPELARGVLRYLSATQSTETDPSRAAEPGKILHETRKGEMANLGEVPFGRYYGSVDATPLFVLLAAQYYEVTANRALIEEIWPSVERALDWIGRYGDRDGDGFVEYMPDPAGLVHQGWKDSHDSIFHADGSDPEGAIALCEVQGYVYAAYRGAAQLCRALGRHERADLLERSAHLLRQRFEEHFWDERLGTYVIALDGKKRPCRIRGSNAGHALFARIASPARAACVANMLSSESMFSGWGVRTLARGEPRYNPMSYHNGSIWPHDNAILAQGLSAYGYRQEALRILLALFEATQYFETRRLPELFCGFMRQPGEGPTVYPVACSPQAWASGAAFQLLASCLGLSIDATRRRLQFSHPVLPPFLQELKIEGLRVGDMRIDLMLHHYADDVGIHVLHRSGPIEVVNIK